MSLFKESLASWATGVDDSPAHTPDNGARVVVLENPAALSDLRESGVISEESVVLVGGQVPVTAANDRVVSYDGELGEPYGEAHLSSGFGITVMPYALGRYIPLNGPTLLRVTEASDFAAFIEDADAAQETGTFAQLLISPTALLGDQPALGLWLGRGGPTDRIWVAKDGTVSTSPTGVPLGGVSSSLIQLDQSWQEAATAHTAPDSIPLDRAVDDEERTQALINRPWIGRYLASLGLLRDLGLKGLDAVQVSGFGHRLNASIPAHGPSTDERLLDTTAEQPLLCFDDESGYLANRAGRIVRISRELAGIAEILLARGASSNDLVPAEELVRISAWFAERGFTFPQPATTLEGAR